MAATRIIPMHVNKGKTIAQCLSDRTDYAQNPEKTNDGTLISCYACDRHTADAEFLFAKRQYFTLTGREQKNDVIAYQVRQSFKPGEVTAEEANKIGYEFAARFLKGKHAFLVATHIDKHHIHNHIIWNSTALDCKHKYRNFLGSIRAVAHLSDMVCMEHKLSVIENPKRGSTSYNKWLGERATPSNRDELRRNMDSALQQEPESFDAFLDLLRESGYEVKIGSHISFRKKDGKRMMRMRSLGEGYSEEDIRAVISGRKHHTPRKRRAGSEPPKANLLIDIQAKLDAGKGAGYERWAKVFNLKQMAQTMLYLQEHSIADYGELSTKTDSATARLNELRGQIKEAEQRMSEIAVLKTHIINYAKTRNTFTEYRQSGYSKKFHTEHEAEIALHRAAKRAFNERELKKLPTVKRLQTEYAELMSGKKAAYEEYHQVKRQQRELLIHQANVRQILDLESKEKGREPERSSDNRSVI